MTNIEIKAKSRALRKIRAALLQNKAKYIGTDKQTDTYFKVAKPERLKNCARAT